VHPLDGMEVGRVLSAERTRKGFALHLVDDRPRELKVRKRDRREVESAMRELGVVMVDQFGCRIDISQFEKEADPSFNRKIGPGFWGFWVLAFGPSWAANRMLRRHMRQLSDNG
jgi:hypothetical protein